MKRDSEVAGLEMYRAFRSARKPMEMTPLHIRSGFKAGYAEGRKVAVLVPCYNEEEAVASVVRDFRAALPDATIFVFDNNSSDNTAAVARAAGAKVFCERQQGKGFVVRRMFADVDADIYVLVDGDATYEATSARTMINRLLEDQLDMVVGNRVHRERAAYRSGHRTGNWLLTSFVGYIFGPTFKDILSGYRVLSRRFVKSFPMMSGGFEVETELTIHALQLGLPAAEVETPYYPRRAGSASKLNTWRDGLLILRTIINLYRAERPLAFFAGTGLTFAFASVVLAIPIFLTHIESGLEPRYPTAVFSTGLMIMALLSVSVGLVLDTVTRGRREEKLLAYLAQPAPNIREELETP